MTSEIWLVAYVISLLVVPPPDAGSVLERIHRRQVAVFDGSGAAPCGA
jgi:hypothetical protein